MNKDICRWQKSGNASQRAHRTSRWAKIMTKWLITKNYKRGAKWQVINFLGDGKSESRGIVDLLAIRKNHRKQNTKIKRGDLFEIVLIQVKGGSASLPTTEEVKRLKVVAEYHRAKTIVLSEWKPKKLLRFYPLKENRWIETKPNKIF